MLSKFNWKEKKKKQEFKFSDKKMFNKSLVRREETKYRETFSY